MLGCNYLNADFYFSSELITHPGSKAFLQADALTAASSAQSFLAM